jgi:protein O-mannosyl-transferase
MGKTKPAPALNQIRSKWKSIHIDDIRSRLLLVFACIVCYGNTIYNEYALDDDFAVTQNAYIQRGIAGIPDLLTHSYATTHDKSMDYRPVTGITLAIEQQFFPSNPHVSHVGNIVLFAFVVLLIFEVLKRVFSLDTYHPFLPFLIAFIYAIHPVHTEVVASIKNRDEILSLVFILLAFLFVHFTFKATAKKAWYAVAVFVFLLLSFTSKMTSLPFIAIIILTGYYHRFHKQKSFFYIFHFFLIAFSVTYFGIIIYFLERPMYDLENPLITNNDILVRLGTGFETLLFYFKFMLFPFPFRFYYGYNVIPLISLGTPTAIFSVMLYLVLFAYGAMLFLRKQVLGLFILCYLLGIFLYSNLLIIYPGIVSERILFSPSLWFIAALVMFLYHMAKFDQVKAALNVFQKIIIITLVIVAEVFTWLTIQRNFQWKNTLTLMSSDIDNLRNSTLANYFYGSLLEEEARKSLTYNGRKHYFENAKKHYRQALNISPGYPEPYFKMGMILEYEEQQYDSAFEYFRKGYPLDTSNSPAQFQLAKSYFLKSNYAEADKLFTPLYQKMPEDTFTLFFFSRVKYFMGDTLNASLINEQLKRLAPESYYSYWNQALFLHNSGRFVEAIPFYEIAITYGYKDPVIFKQLANYYSAKGQTDKLTIIQRLMQ